MDRLSDLPKHILYNILSRMPVRDGVRTSILSKAWNHTWSTFPILNFRQDRYVQRDNRQNIEDRERKRNNFTNHVDKTLTRFHDQGLAIREFKLDMDYYDSRSIYPRIDYWMRLAVESGVQVLDLSLFYGGDGNSDGDDDNCCLPPCILEAKSLSKLILSWSMEVDHAFVNNPIQFSSLQVLSLFMVTLEDEQIIQNIISSCPLIEYLTLDHCCTLKSDQRGLKSVRIHGLRKLKRIVALYIQEIDIDAPNVEDFEYAPAHVNAPFKTNLDKCRNLRGLHLSNLETIIITDQWLLELFRKFPLLERLKLRNCRFSERIKLSCVSLKVLEIHYGSNLKEVIIDAPNLCSLRYRTCVEMPILTFLKRSSLMQVDVILRLANYWGFPKLREFLQSFEHRDILASLSLRIPWLPKEFNPDVLRDISVSLPSIKHLNVEITSRHVAVSHLVIGLLWSCCPASISMALEFTICNSAMKVLYDVLMGVKHDECCCSSSDIKCWWHGLKKVTRTVENVCSEAYPDGLPTVTLQLEY